MRLPNAENAIVDEVKVRDYLLSSEHPVGRFKARVFRAAGYQRENWTRLRDDLRILAQTLDVAPTHADEFGQRFIGTGQLPAPNGRPLPVVSVWLIPSEAVAPRLITAYPAAES
jgi:hypothetical protein